MPEDRPNSNVLSQAEVDSLLRAISGGEFEEESSPRRVVGWGIRKLTKFLTDPFGVKQREYDERWMFRKAVPETFRKATRQVRLFDDKGEGESRLAEIRRKNEAQGSGNIKIPGTEIELINYTYCPKCKTVFSHAEVQAYYADPNPVEGLDRNAQFRGDTRMHCRDCDEYFHHTLVISDGSPRNECWYLCKSQTLGAIERYYEEQGERVLTMKRENRLESEDGRLGILNDADIATLSREPALLTSLLQYTPPELIPSFVNGKNLENRDLLFGAWL